MVYYIYYLTGGITYQWEFLLMQVDPEPQQLLKPLLDTVMKVREIWMTPDRSI